METITKEELKSKLDTNHDFKLVMTLGAFHFMAKRIPGSTFYDNPELMFAKLDKKEKDETENQTKRIFAGKGCR